MTHRLLLFDIDGTLLRTGGAGMRSMANVAARLFGEQFRWDGIVASGSLDPVIFAEAAALNQLADHESHHDRFRDHYVDELTIQLEQNRHLLQVMPGIHALLGELQQRAQRRGDVVLGLLTGNYTAAVPVKLRAAGINPDWFTITCFGDEAPTRPDMVALALRKYERMFGRAIEPRRVIVIGDTPRDVDCAKAHGCTAFCVATGGYDVNELRDAGADIAVESLDDPAPLYALLGL